MGRRLRALLLGIHRLPPAVDDVAVDPVLDVGRPVERIEEALGVGLVLGEEQRRGALGVEEPLSELRMRGRDHTAATADGLAEHRPGRIAPR